MSDLNILLTPSSSGMAITAIKALREAEDIRIISTDVEQLAPGLHLSDVGYKVPPFSDDRFYNKILKIVEEESVQLVIPAYDPILKDFSNKREVFQEKGSEILVSNPKSIEITMDKWKTFKKLEGLIPLPRSFITIENIDFRFPLFIKPREGSGSKNAFKVDSKKELEYLYSKIEKPIIQEFLPGKEYTVDCISDRNGNLRVSVPRLRLETKAGISIKGKVVESSKLEKMAEIIAEELKIQGPFLFQAREDEDGMPKLTEINPRIGGTMCPKFMEPNFHISAVKLFIDGELDKPEIKYGMKVSRYWEEIYLKNNDNKKSVIKDI